jgi:hypothetical protein
MKSPIKSCPKRSTWFELPAEASVERKKKWYNLKGKIQSIAKFDFSSFLVSGGPIVRLVSESWESLCVKVASAPHIKQ